MFEKLRKVQPGIKRGAAVGALAGFFGSLTSSIILLLLSVLGQQPLGASLASTLYVFIVLAISIVLDTLLAAFGGALVVKFTA